MKSNRKTNAKTPPAAPAPKRKKPAAAKNKPAQPPPDKKSEFLVEFGESGSVSETADNIGIARSAHYRWLVDDPEYKAAFLDQRARTGGHFKDVAVRLATKGHFEPYIYRGKYCYELRERTRCTLADGTEEFEDRLPDRHPKILKRRTVMTPDGDQIGVWKIDTGMLSKLLAALLPDEFGPALISNDNADPPQYIVTLQQR